MLQMTYNPDRYVDFSRNVQTCLHHVVYLLLCGVHSLQVSTKNEI